VKVRLVAAGAHLSPEHGSTVREIEADGFTIDDRLEMLLSSDSPVSAAKSIGLGTIGFADIFSRCSPDMVLIIGDRYELLSVACAALPFRIPIAHVSGGDCTEGAIDNQVRNAVSMMSSVHFVAMQEHGNRLVQMGEEPWRVFVTGDPALDAIDPAELLPRTELEDRLMTPLESPVLVVTFHPTTLGSQSVSHEIVALLGALAKVDGTLIFTASNPDVGRNVVMENIREFVARRASARLFTNLGQKLYYSLLSVADAMVGNSSSGIWEAPSFDLPVVNIGERQSGRMRSANVLDVQCDETSILTAVHEALNPIFRQSLRGLENPYGDGKAAPRIAKALKEIDLCPGLVKKYSAGVPRERRRFK
jgi:GDP/UDP-N,N'-diacetylbacillosamine 2-epimerase (hydrolysing)